MPSSSWSAIRWAGWSPGISWSAWTAGGTPAGWSPSAPPTGVAERAELPGPRDAETARPGPGAGPVPAAALVPVDLPAAADLPVPGPRRRDGSSGYRRRPGCRMSTPGGPRPPTRSTGRSSGQSPRTWTTRSTGVAGTRSTRSWARSRRRCCPRAGPGTAWRSWAPIRVSSPMATARCRGSRPPRSSSRTRRGRCSPPSGTARCSTTTACWCSWPGCSAGRTPPGSGPGPTRGWSWTTPSARASRSPSGSAPPTRWPR